MSDGSKTDAGSPEELERLRRRNRQLGQSWRLLAENEQAVHRKTQVEFTKFKTIVDKAGHGVAVSDLAGNLTYVNEPFARLHGYEPDELIGKHFSIFHNQEQLERVSQLNRRLIQEGRYLAEEVWHKRKDNTIFPASSSAVVIGDEEGDPLFLAYTAVDITEHKKAENALRESEAKYRTLVESAGEAIATIDAGGAITFMNETAAKRLGGTPRDFVGKTMWDLFPKNFADRQAANVQEAIKTGRPANLTELTSVSGRLRWYNTTIEPLRNSAGEVTAAMVVARDIHEMMQKEAELMKFRAQMARAEQLASLGTLSATVAHQITQPLTVIRLSLDNVLDELMATSCSSTVIRRLQDSIGQLSNITSTINRFRHFARQSSDTRFGEVSLYATADRVLRLLEESARRARVCLYLKSMDGLPSVSMNETDVEQLFFALIENAIQAADGTKARQVVISGAVNAGQVELRFSDTCGGIEPEDLGRIFEPFFTTKSRGHGTGLGLCIVQDIVAHVGGQIRVKSKLGKGTTFFVTIPVKEAAMS
jgi:PAS domain S-box-containing protein